jgi:hypothetical protein
MNAADDNYIKRKLYRARDKKFGVPIWCDRCSTTQLVNSGSGTTFTVDENAYRQFEEGGLLVFLDDYENYEVKEITTIGSNSFTVDSSFIGTWASDTNVYPIIQGRLSRSVTLPHYTTQGHDIVDFEVVEDYDEDITRVVYSGNSFPTYLTYEIFNTEPEYSTCPDSLVEVYPYVTQFFGKSIDYAYSVEGIITSRNNYRFYTREDVYELIKLHDEKRGQWGEFWYPSWQDDIILTSTFLSTDTVLNVEDIEWNDYWRHNKILGRYLYVLLPDGTEIIRKIVSSPSSTQLEVDSAMGTTITSLQNVISCFLHMGRFKSEQLIVKWLTETISEVEVELSTIKDVESIAVTTTTT